MKNYIRTSHSRFLSLGMLLLMVSGWGWNPYRHHPGYPYKLVKETISVQVPVEQAYAYLGDSDNARHWSVFVDHITPLNSDTYPDGTVHSKRRCFKQADEKGIWWDEEVLETRKDKHRLLSIYHLHGFPLQAEHLLTEQVYERVNTHECRVSLTLYFEPGKASKTDLLKMHIASYVVRNIFRNNLKQIKYEMEHHAAS